MIRAAFLEAAGCGRMEREARGFLDALQRLKLT
jgi:hypothetical protein